MSVGPTPRRSTFGVCVRSEKGVVTSIAAARFSVQINLEVIGTIKLYVRQLGVWSLYAERTPSVVLPGEGLESYLDGWLRREYLISTPYRLPKIYSVQENWTPAISDTWAAKSWNHTSWPIQDHSGYVTNVTSGSGTNPYYASGSQPFAPGTFARGALGFAVDEYGFALVRVTGTPVGATQLLAMFDFGDNPWTVPADTQLSQIVWEYRLRIDA